MKITVTQNQFHGHSVLYEGKSETQAIRVARKYACVECRCGGPSITREDGANLIDWDAGKPFVQKEHSPFWVTFED
uniref:Uncharacterized protein n=1 Tax=viral metagenome TaxID=1070528 RepID=A0A6M3KKQ3_9ZZZZ